MEKREQVSVALEELALQLGESGAVPVPELVRALERAAERLRTRSVSPEMPTDLVTQSQAARAIGVSRQAVNQWVRSGVLSSYIKPGANSRYAPEVSLAEAAICANRKSGEVPFSTSRRRQLLEFLDMIADDSVATIAHTIKESLEEDSPLERELDQTRVLREFVMASMESGGRQHEFTEAGVRLLSELNPELEVDLGSPFGRLGESLGLLVKSAQGVAGFDSLATALLGMLGAATLGTLYDDTDTACAHAISSAAQHVWGEDWPTRLLDAAFHVGALRPSPMTRYTASLTYLDYNRFLRQAQSAGISVAYSRGPGIILPQRFYGAPILADILADRGQPAQVWRFSPAAATCGWPAALPSAVSPFRIFNYEYGLLDTTIHGIRRYCFSAHDAREEIRNHAESLRPPKRTAYIDLAVRTLARALSLAHIELVAVDRQADFDWWKDHIIRASPREILLGLRDDRARKVAHALLVPTSRLPNVVEAAEADGSLRERLRIYVKNLEFDVIDARYRDDLRRGVTRVLKPGGHILSADEAQATAVAEIEAYLR